MTEGMVVGADGVCAHAPAQRTMLHTIIVMNRRKVILRSITGSMSTARFALYYDGILLLLTKLS